MKRAQFVAAVLCALLAAGCAIRAASNGDWPWFGLGAVAFVVCVVVAFIVAVRSALPMGRA
jgi:hypothetical protein